MGDDIVSEIMQAEQTTARIQAEAQAKADGIIAAAKKEAISMREAARAEAQKKAQGIIEQGKHTAEDARTQIIAAAQQENAALETEIATNVEAAVAYVVRQILGQV